MAVWFAWAMGSSLLNTRKPLVIDFTLADFVSPASVGVDKVRPGKRLAGSTGKEKEIPRNIPASLPQTIKSEPALAHISQVRLSAATDAVTSTSPPSAAVTVPSGSNSILTGGESTGAGRGPALVDTSSPGSGSGTSTEQMRGKYLKENFTYIRDLIQKNLAYPARARKMGWTGKVVVSFTVLEDGHVANERVLAGSGHALLDGNVIETIRNVEPFPKPPVRAELRIPVYFRLD